MKLLDIAFVVIAALLLAVGIGLIFVPAGIICAGVLVAVSWALFVYEAR